MNRKLWHDADTMGRICAYRIGVVWPPTVGHELARKDVAEVVAVPGSTR